MTRVVLDGKAFIMMPESEYEEIKGMLKEDATRQMTRRDIAKYLGISYQRLSEKPWLLPYFGEGLTKKRNATWAEREVTNWLKTPEEVLKERFYGRNGN